MNQKSKWNDTKTWSMQKNNSHMRNQQFFRTLKVRGWTKIVCLVNLIWMLTKYIWVFPPSLLYLVMQVTKRLTCLNFVATLGPFLGKYFRQSKGWGGLSSSQLISAEWRVRTFRQKDTLPKGLPPPDRCPAKRPRQCAKGNSMSRYDLRFIPVGTHLVVGSFRQRESFPHLRYTAQLQQSRCSSAAPLFLHKINL